MKISREDMDRIVVLRMEGKLLGGPTAGDVKTMIQDAIDEGKANVIIDLGGVTLANSTGLGILVSALVTLRRHGGDLKLLRAPKRIGSALQITWLDRVFDLYDSEESVLASF